MSIIRLGVVVVVAVVVGVTLARHISFYDDEGDFQPIVTTSQEKRICAELCMSGLGGTVCGDNCIDITPQNLPLKQQYGSSNDSGGRALAGGLVNATSSASSRHSACNVLCINQLGYPLCNCDDILETTTARHPLKAVNFLQICANFCEEHNYQLYGCQKCEVYKKYDANEGKLAKDDAEKSKEKVKRSIFDQQTYDWDKWCQKVCASGDGGAACYCDLLPFGLQIN